MFYPMNYRLNDIVINPVAYVSYSSLDTVVQASDDILACIYKPINSIVEPVDYVSLEPGKETHQVMCALSRPANDPVPDSIPDSGDSMTKIIKPMSYVMFQTSHDPLAVCDPAHKTADSVIPDHVPHMSNVMTDSIKVMSYLMTHYLE